MEEETISDEQRCIKEKGEKNNGGNDKTCHVVAKH